MISLFIETSLDLLLAAPATTDLDDGPAHRNRSLATVAWIDGQSKSKKIVVAIDSWPLKMRTAGTVCSGGPPVRLPVWDVIWARTTASKRARIRCAFTFDHHFAAVGFRI
jgi:hypothetical protein